MVSGSSESDHFTGIVCGFNVMGSLMKGIQELCTFFISLNDFKIKKGKDWGKKKNPIGE